MKWRIRFRGRKIGAIGITYPIEEIVSCDSGIDPVLSLYDRFQDIRVLSVTSVENTRPDAAREAIDA